MQVNDYEAMFLDWLSRYRCWRIKLARTFVRTVADQGNLLQEIAF